MLNPCSDTFFGFFTIPLLRCVAYRDSCIWFGFSVWGRNDLGFLFFQSQLKLA